MGKKCHKKWWRKIKKLKKFQEKKKVEMKKNKRKKLKNLLNLSKKICYTVECIKLIL